MALSYNEWVDTTDYLEDAKVLYDGVIYRASTAITGSAGKATPDQDPEWILVAVNKIQSRHSLYQAVRLEINTTDETIVDSIPMFVQLAEESFTTRIRTPIQRSTTMLTVDSESRITIPFDLLEVINLRESTASSSAYNDLRARGTIEILAGNIEEYREMKAYFEGGNSRFSYTEFEAPIYWYDGEYFYIAPNYEEGTEIELIYYSSIPQLGTTVFEINGDGAAVNDAGQTVAEWVAAGGGNTEDNFVQASAVVNVNWFIQAAPQMLLYGSLVNAHMYLRDDEKLDVWQKRFIEAERETVHKIEKFNAIRAHTQQLGNIYNN